MKNVVWSVKKYWQFLFQNLKKYVLFVFHSTIFRQIQQGAVISPFFIQNSHKIHPIARPWGWDLGCLLWGQTLINVLPQFLQCCVQYMMTSSNGNIFHITGLLSGELTGHQWIPCTRASDVELWCVFFICTWINGWVNNREAGDLRCHCAHYDVIVMIMLCWTMLLWHPTLCSCFKHFNA